MIDPQKITDYNRTDAQLQEFLLFTIAVAGKTASVISRQLENFLNMTIGTTPYNKIQTLIRLGKLRQYLQKAKLGKYSVLEKAFTQVLDLDLRTCSLEQLELVHGIGPKTARYFLLHSRRDQKVVPLDTHMLRFLREKGYDAPKSTPTGKRYLELELVVIAEAEKAGKSVADFDLDIWNSSSTRSGRIG